MEVLEANACLIGYAGELHTGMIRERISIRLAGGSFDRLPNCAERSLLTGKKLPAPKITSKSTDKIDQEVSLFRLRAINTTKLNETTDEHR